ncbi:hypothetical protein E4U17_003943 [Claviceps sp. LM77 group G4]|nr:hypothetical protein E4U17_003943 [Claviceps sp. LM77 group G4]
MHISKQPGSFGLICIDIHPDTPQRKQQMMPGTTTYNQRAPSSKASNTAQQKQKQKRPIPQILVSVQRDARTGCTYYFRDKLNVMSLHHTLAQVL